jgi:hypothetical protein
MVNKAKSYLLRDLLLFHPFFLHQLLPALIESKVVQDGGLTDMLLEYLKHLKALFKAYLKFLTERSTRRTGRNCHFAGQNKLSESLDNAYLLGVTAVCDRLVLIVLQDDVLENVVRHVFDNLPLNREGAIPLVLLPVLQGFLEINSTNHFSNTNKLATCIHLKNY